MSRADLLRLLASVDAFVAPSRGASLGLSCMEAMSMALPCIATNWGGATEFLSEDVAIPLPFKVGKASGPGIAVGSAWAIADVPQLQAAMRSLVQDPERGRSIGKAAREHIKSKFDVFKVGAGHRGPGTPSLPFGGSDFATSLGP
jgi:glycosyltransferase involved in cell wall biosynthesis